MVAERRRGSAASRGYDAAWTRFRWSYLSAYPLCADCLKAGGQLRPATEVHHIQKLADRPDLRLDPDNVLGLCKPHHSYRTARGE